MSATDPSNPNVVEEGVVEEGVVEEGVVAAPAGASAASRPASAVRWLAIAVIVAGGILIVAGVVTWFVVQTQLSDEKITVSDDAARFAGDRVDGPLTAYAEADVIEKHALEASGGLTYAELDRDDPTRDTVMTASFLRASLFTSVVAFGVAAMAAGLGLVLVIIGIALLMLTNRAAAWTPPPRTAAAAG